MDKAPDAFRTISEVAEDLDLPQHVLRFWETRFTQIKPLKRGGGRRYYRPDDVLLLRGIKHLLYGEGYTIKGVQRILREQGGKYVISLWQNGIDAASSDQPRPAGLEVFAPPGVRGEPRYAVPLDDDEADDEDDDLSFEPSPSRASVGRVERREEMSRANFSYAPVMDERSPPPMQAVVPGGGKALSREDLRRLQATLYELMECKRILDGAR